MVNRFVKKEPLRLGFIVLSTDLTLERDLALLRPAKGVDFFVTRTPFYNPITEDSLSRLQQDIPHALSLILPDIDLNAVAFGCTAASAVIGSSRISELVKSVEPNAEVTNPFAAILAGLTALGSQSPAMLVPYTKSIADGMKDSFSAQGVKLCNISRLDIEDDRDIAKLDPDYLVEQAVKTTPAQCDALFIACTATPVLGVIHRMEEALNKPILAANQAMIWHSLRLAGYSEPIYGYGRLLEKF